MSALDKYLLYKQISNEQAQQQGGQPPQGGQTLAHQHHRTNPISQGTMDAIHAMKENSLMDEREQNSARTDALMALSRAIAQPTGQVGFGGALARFNAGLQAAYGAYNNTREAYEDRNREMMKYAHDLEKQARGEDLAERKFMHDIEHNEGTLAHQAAQLEETKRAHDLMYSEQQFNKGIQQINAYQDKLDKLDLQKEQEKEKILKNNAARRSNLRNATHNLFFVDKAEEKALENVDRKYEKLKKFGEIHLNNIYKKYGIERPEHVENPTQESRGTAVPNNPSDIVQNLRLSIPGLDKFTDAQILDWAKKRGSYEPPR